MFSIFGVLGETYSNLHTVNKFFVVLYEFSR